tara:strand:+ start:651 stop:860 length:210 start_codon:yes stop_codon:yes gene_type:complete
MGEMSVVTGRIVTYNEEDLNINFEIIESLPSQTDKFFYFITSGKSEYLPIPQNEIDLQGSDILIQNPGY